MFYTVIKHSGHLRTLEKCRKHSPAAHVFYISLVFSNARRVLWQYKTWLRLLYLLNNTTRNENQKWKHRLGGTRSRPIPWLSWLALHYYFTELYTGISSGHVAALVRSHMSGWENNRTNNRNNVPSPQNNSSCYTRGPVELQAYESCYTTDFILARFTHRMLQLFVLVSGITIKSVPPNDQSTTNRPSVWANLPLHYSPVLHSAKQS